MKKKLLLFFAVFITAFSVNAQVTGVAVVGEAAGGWPGDPGNPGPNDIHQMTSTDGENWTLNDLVLINAGTGCVGVNCGGIKFRANNSWTTNWGSVAFPSGVGVQNGINIQCVAGTYDVTFNSTTGAYTFTAEVPPPVVKIVGTAVNGGTLTMTQTSTTTFSLSLTTFLSGNAQFEVNGNLLGGSTFPTGTTVDSSLFIPVTAGAYTTVTYDISSGNYVFSAAPVFPLIGLIGSAITGDDTGWVQDVDMTTSNGINYYLGNQALLDVNSSNTSPAGLKFRENNAWTNAWGGTSFPNGPISGNSEDIIVTAAGTYNVYFNYNTKAYNFVKVGSISLVGDAVGGWPQTAGNPGPVDIHMMSTTDDENYTLTNLVVVAGPCKFRQDNDWGIPSFGGVTFPTGSNATDNGDIIVPVGQEGTYDVTFNKSTKAYTFVPSLATKSFDKSNFIVYPNPTNSYWNFSSGNEKIVSIQVVDLMGKVITTSTATTVDASALSKGVYFAKVSTAYASKTIKLVKK